MENLKHIRRPITEKQQSTFTKNKYDLKCNRRKRVKYNKPTTTVPHWKIKGQPFTSSQNEGHIKYNLRSMNLWMSYGLFWKLASWIYTAVLWFVNHQSCDNCQVRCIRSVRSAKTRLNISLNTSSVCPRPECHEMLPRQTWKGPENPCQSSTDGLKEE